MRKLSLLSAFIILGASMAATAMAAPSIYPTGTTIYDPAKAENGYVLISVDYKNVYSRVDSKGVYNSKPDYKGGVPRPDDSDEIFLIDMNGNVVNRWKDLGDNKKVYLLPNGNILSISEPQSAVIEYDWDGNVVWKYATKLGPHHDGRRLENGNTLILCYEKVPSKANVNVHNQTTQWWGTQERKNIELRGDTIIEVNPQGKIVWDWNSSEHLDLNRYLPLTGMSDWTHGNTVSIIPPNKWYDKGDKRFKPGNIMFNPRHFDSFVIIDKDTKEVVWELPKEFKAMGGLGQCHEPIMIAKGLPGEGNIMIFDNGLFTRNGAHAAQSIIWEIRPDTSEVVWRYMPAMMGSTKFLSKYKGSAYKLKNGNVLISEDYSGRAFQVRPDKNHPDGGEIVWEYQYDSVISRTSMYPYDFTPQLKAMKKPQQLKVSPIHPVQFKVLPDALRRDGNAVRVIPE